MYIEVTHRDNRTFTMVYAQDIAPRLIVYVNNTRILLDSLNDNTVLESIF